jgi:hypothetical protein
MTKKQIVLYAVAALFVISGIVALPSGNFTGAIGCIVIAAVCALIAKKSRAAVEGKKKTGAPAHVSGSRIAETIRTKVVGVTFDNEDGENRQSILSSMNGSEDIEIEKYTYNGEPAAYVKWGNKILGNLSAELARDLAGKYPNASYTAEILDISGGVCRHMAVI